MEEMEWWHDANWWSKEMKEMYEERGRMERLRMKELPGILKRAGWKYSSCHDDIILHHTATPAFREVFTPRPDVSLETVRFALDFFKTMGHYSRKGMGNFGGADVLDAMLRCFEMRPGGPIDSLMLLVMADSCDTFSQELVYLWHDIHPEPPAAWCSFCAHCIDAEGRRLDKEEYPYSGGGRNTIRVMCHPCHEEKSEEKSCHVCVHSAENCDDDAMSDVICVECKVCVEGYDELTNPKSEAWKNKPTRIKWVLRPFDDYWDNPEMCAASHNGTRD